MITTNKNTLVFGIEKTGLSIEEAAELLKYPKVVKYYYYEPYKQGGIATVKNKDGKSISVEFHVKYCCYTSLDFNN